MKVLLTSAGFENCMISKVFLNQINKDPKDIKVVFIPTAADSADSIAMLPKCMNDLLNIGINKENVYVYDLHYKMKFSFLSNYDAVYVCGGNTDYLIQRINKSGFRKELLKYITKNGVYIGVSAGSCIMANNVEKSLGLINKTINVHCDNGETPGPLNKDMKPIYLTNKQAILLSNKNDGSVIE